MSVIGLLVGPYEIVAPARLPGPTGWYVARRTGGPRRRAPSEVLVRLLGHDATERERAAMQREFNALKSVDDPRIPTTVAFYEGSAAMVVEHVSAAGVREVIAGRADNSIALTPATLLDLLLEATETLHRLHQRDRFHGALDPDRLALGADGSTWVLGFGDERPPDSAWVSPEASRGEPLSAATDQWSMAALATSLISGRVPDPEPPVALVEAQWPALAQLLRRMLDPVPENRFPSLQPVRQELGVLAQKAGGTSDRRELGARLAELADVEPPEPDEPEASTTESLVLPSEEPTRILDLDEVVDPNAITREIVRPDPPLKRPPLPSEPIPVVRLEVPQDDDGPPIDEEETADRTESVGQLLDRIATQKADVEPSDQTVLFPDEALKRALADMDADDTSPLLPAVEPTGEAVIAEDPDEEATVLARDAALMENWGSGPTAVPATDSGESPVAEDAAALGVVGQASTGAEWFHTDPKPDDGLRPDPSLGLGDPVDTELLETEVVEVQPPTEVGPTPPDLPALRRAVPILVLVLGALLVAWAAVRFL